MQLLFKLFVFISAFIFYAQCDDDTHENVTFHVATILESPFTMFRDGQTILTDNERFEGYMVDLIEELAKRLNFRYKMYIIADNKYGAQRDNEWDGLIGEVVKGRADIGAAAITMTSEREAAIDFTVPFMHLGITTLYKRSGEKLPFKNLEELAALKTTNVGCIRGGSTHAFFAGSENPTYKRIFERMEPSTLVNTVSEGIDRVKTEDYAFFMESSALEYVVERDCDLQQVGGLLNSKGFGLLVPKGSPMRTKLSQAILELEETGALAALKLKWWKRRNGEQCVN